MASAIGNDSPLDVMYADYVPQEVPAVSRRKKKLTVDEKKALKRKEEQDFRILEMRDRMQREYEMSKKTARKYRERWENMCREIKLKDMRKELQDWQEKINRVVKQKDEKIKLILEEIAETQEMHGRSFCAQLQMMDYLIDIMKAFQDTSQLLYEKEACDLLHDFYRETEERKSIEHAVKENCESVVHATELVAEQELLSDYKIYLDKRDDRVNSEIEKRYRLKEAVMGKMKKLHEQLLEFLDSALNASLDAQKYERVNALMQRQRNFHTETVKLSNLEAKASRTQTELQRALAQEERMAKRKLNDLRLEHAYFLQLRKNIEKEIKLNSEKTHEKLKIITSESFKVLQKYKKLLKFGELLLSLAASCRRFQTQAEKVLPWGNFLEPENESEADNEQFKLQIIELKQHMDIGEAELQSSAQLMRNFWRRQAVLEAEVILLEAKKVELQKENQIYIDTIRRLRPIASVDDLKATLRVEQVSDAPH